MLGDASGRVKHLGAVDDSAVASMAGCWRDTEVEEPREPTSTVVKLWGGVAGQGGNGVELQRGLGILANPCPRSYETCYDD